MPLVVGASRGLIPGTEAPGARATLVGVRPSDAAQIVRNAAQRGGFQQTQYSSEPTGGAFTGRKRTQLVHIRVAEETNLLVRWRAMGDRQTLLEWTAFTSMHPTLAVHQPAASDGFAHWLTGEIEAFFQRPPPPRLPVNPVVRPGEVPPPRYDGQIYDYGPLTPGRLLGQLQRGSLPLGRSAFGRPGQVEHGAALFLPPYNNRPREELGIVVCAPSGRGKTHLMLRWACAAIRAGRSVLLVDVKGNMRSQLEAALAREGLRAKIDTFTAAAGQASVRMNLLAGIDASQRNCPEQLMLLAQILVPKEVYRGDAAVWYPIALRILRGVMQILKLLQFYGLLDGPPGREADLVDLYTMIVAETEVVGRIIQLRRCERAWRAEGRTMACYSVEECVQVMALALGNFEWDEPEGDGARKEGFYDGQRPPEQTYRQYIEPMLYVLDALRPSGVLAERVRSFGPGEEVRLDAFSRGRSPAVLLMSVREEDSSLAGVMLGLVMSRLRQELDKRRNLPAAELGELLLLLDETARIPGFNAGEFVSIARESRVGYAFVYQDLSMIGEADLLAGKPDSTAKLLGNIGSLVFLYGIADKNLDRLNSLRPGRERSREMQTGQNSSAGGPTRGFNQQSRNVPFLEPIAAEHLPAGRYPALVLLRDGPAFLVDLDDGG